MPDPVHENPSQVFLELEALLDDLDERLDRVEAAVDEVFVQVRLRSENAQSYLEHSLSEKLRCVIRLHEVADREYVEKLCIAPVRKVQTVEFEVFYLLPPALLVLTFGFYHVVVRTVLRNNQMRLEELAGDQDAGAASVSYATFRERVLNLLDLDLLPREQVELIEHLAEGV